MTLGERLKQLRLEKGITQEELGKIIGLKKQAIWKYENGNVTNMKRSTIKTLSDYFDVSPSYLMGYSDKRKETTSPINSEIVSAFQNLSEIQQEQVLNFIKFLSEGKQ